ncbi:antirestriction protein ArdA [Clostridium beijerinckii]|nr:antirestriction protein ArdA [Clostridium beijerinckii]
MINVYITNLGKYNEGDLIGKWLELPATDEEIENVLKEIGIDGVLYEEYFFTDWEVIDGIEIKEYSSLKELNEIAGTLENLNEVDLEICQCLMKNENCTLDEAMEKKDNRIIINLEKNTMIDECSNLAYSYINEIYGDVSDLSRETLERYFDFKSFGRDLSYDYFIDYNLNIAISNN